MFDTILLAVDGSEHALRATAAAAEMARKHQSRLWVVTVVSPLPGTYAAGLGADNVTKLENFQQEQAQELLEQTKANLGEVAAHAQTEVLHGTPAEMILQAVETYQADLVVMGSRGLGRLGGLLLGSQSQRVIQHANCPVLLVK
jgi:nucleotide-binding universal stress UspA family protein